MEPQFHVVELDGRLGALEVEAGGQLALGLVDGVSYLLHVNLGDDVKGGHGATVAPPPSFARAVDLVSSLPPGAVDDRPAAVTVAGRSLDLSALVGAAGAVAARIRGLPSVAVDATASLETVVAVLGGLAAGVPVVPLAPDAGPLERTHVLSHSAAPVLLAAADSGHDGGPRAGSRRSP